MNDSRRPIVVGVDQSPEAQLALRWATGEAERRDLPVHVLMAYEWPVTTLGVDLPAPADPPESVRLVFEEALAFVRDRLGAARTTGALLSSRPAPLLVSESETAELLVVGSRSRSTLASAVLGSVSGAVAAHARCPVVVVRRPRSTAASAQRIVVGVDGSAGSDLALDFAFEEAALRGFPLAVVHVWQPVQALDPAAWTPEREEADRKEVRREITARVAPYEEKYPTVNASVSILEGRAANVLVGQSRTAQLVVVGTRGHGGLAGLLLGSVSQSLLHHAHCGVAVVRNAHDDSTK